MSKSMLSDALNAINDRNILNDAIVMTSHDRNTQYGEPEDCFKRIAGLYHALCSGYNALDAIIQRLH